MAVSLTAIEVNSETRTFTATSLLILCLDVVTALPGRMGFGGPPFWRWIQLPPMDLSIIQLWHLLWRCHKYLRWEDFLKQDLSVEFPRFPIL